MSLDQDLEDVSRRQGTAEGLLHRRSMRGPTDATLSGEARSSRPLRCKNTPSQRVEDNHQLEKDALREMFTTLERRISEDPSLTAYLLSPTGGLYSCFFPSPGKRCLGGA